MKQGLQKFLLVLAAALIGVLMLTKNVFAENNNPTPKVVGEIINKNVSGENATTFGIVIWDLKNNKQYLLNKDEQFKAASLYKLGVMYILFYLEEKGMLNTNKTDIKENLDSMITASSNESALYLVDKYTGWSQINKLLKSKGLRNTDFEKDPILTTPGDMARLLKLINDPNDLSPKASEKMFNLLARQEINDRIPKMLPKDVLVAHKTGELEDVRHDAGIITGFNNTKYILVIMTKNSNVPEDIKPVMAKISLEIYRYFSVI
ncbi:MAG: hypothetical protein COU81_00075 [Candidatus Portnoybacteria bacterium CG10_big_fil_rev_8_21_14_0_10_36_7]|uniref:Beta-lactamase class A catalytic domain-containing protein n=1 Tax=Candidatus Portnoybacteria bacterium CG10_big_fil_rev_8_21_14_0_10_36_7 TaxID=1974812 RepID=A0A2M8KF58_9BACT|nr:MAG: hypothetical protein COU81_00075 [Candidatus Portnoybacteria bacterium CG10_big_fil_rev_8_21_14_0_10_36_7]